eukprot:jgi/Botrbrau1/5374/Bobra.0346s0038.1
MHAARGASLSCVRRNSTYQLPGSCSPYALDARMAPRAEIRLKKKGTAGTRETGNPPCEGPQRKENTAMAAYAEKCLQRTPADQPTVQQRECVKSPYGYRRRPAKELRHVISAP